MAKEKKMVRIAVKRVGYPMEVAYSTLKPWDAMKEHLPDAMIERYPIGRNILVHLDEEGKLTGQKHNFFILFGRCDLWGRRMEDIVGDVVFMKEHGAGYASAGLSDDDLKFIEGIILGKNVSEY